MDTLSYMSTDDILEELSRNDIIGNNKRIIHKSIDYLKGVKLPNYRIIQYSFRVGDTWRFDSLSDILLSEITFNSSGTQYYISGKRSQKGGTETYAWFNISALHRINTQFEPLMPQWSCFSLYECIRRLANNTFHITDSIEQIANTSKNGTPNSVTVKIPIFPFKITDQDIIFEDLKADAIHTSLDSLIDYEYNERNTGGYLERVKFPEIEDSLFYVSYCNGNYYNFLGCCYDTKYSKELMDFIPKNNEAFAFNLNHLMAVDAKGIPLYPQFYVLDDIKERVKKLLSRRSVGAESPTMWKEFEEEVLNIDCSPITYKCIELYSPSYKDISHRRIIGLVKCDSQYLFDIIRLIKEFKFILNNSNVIFQSYHFELKYNLLYGKRRILVERESNDVTITHGLGFEVTSIQKLINHFVNDVRTLLLEMKYELTKDEYKLLLIDVYKLIKQ